jgi:hypothetical protein
METIRLRITAVICAFLLAAGFSFAAQPGTATSAAPQPGNTTMGSPQPAAKTSRAPAAATAAAPAGELPALCARAPALCSTKYPSSSPMLALPAARETVTLGLPDAVAAEQSAQADGQKQGKPTSGTQPSLEGLGFPSSVTKGSVQEQALLDKRSHMLQIHQKLGLITAVPMAISLFTGPGAKGHHGLPGSPGGRNLHVSLGVVTTALYIATAYYAIRAPKVQGTEPRGLIRLHRALAWVHGPGMVITPILGAIAYSQLNNGERIHGVARYHSVAAVTTFSAYMAALLSVSLK